MTMRVFFILFFLTISLDSQGSDKLCNQIVKLTTSNLVDVISRLTDSFTSNVKTQCSSQASLKDQLVEAIIKEDKDRFNKVLDNMENSFIFKLLKTISKDEDLANKFRSFLNEKFNTLTSRMTSNEKILLQEDPLKTLYVFFQYNLALEFIRKKDPKLYLDINKPFGKADAIRHMLINASASRFGMASYVKRMSTLRELSGGYIEYDEKSWRTFNEKDFNSFHEYTFNDLVRCNPKVDMKNIKKSAHETMLDKMIINKMDIHNNSIGISIGESNPCLSMDDIYKKVSAQYDGGKAKEIVSAAGRCFDVSSNYDKYVNTNDETHCGEINSDGLILKKPSNNNQTSCY